MLKGRLKVGASFPVGNGESWKIFEHKSDMCRVEYNLEVGVGKTGGEGTGGYTGLTVRTCCPSPDWRG